MLNQIANRARPEWLRHSPHPATLSSSRRKLRRRLVIRPIRRDQRASGALGCAGAAGKAGAGAIGACGAGVIGNAGPGPWSMIERCTLTGLLNNTSRMLVAKNAIASPAVVRVN